MTQTVLVTGGTSGIGAGVADVLNIAGYQVIAATVSQEEIDQVIKKIEEKTKLSVLNTPKLEEFYVGLYLPV